MKSILYTFLLVLWQHVVNLFTHQPYTFHSDYNHNGDSTKKLSMLGLHCSLSDFFSDANVLKFNMYNGFSIVKNCCCLKFNLMLYVSSLYTKDYFK